MAKSAKPVPKVLRQITLPVGKGDIRLWGKGSGGGYPWRKK